MDNQPTKKMKIEISEKTYKLLMHAYDEFSRAKSLLPKKIVDKYGSSFDEFVDQTLYEYCQLSKRGSELSSKLKNIVGNAASNFDFSSMGDIDPTKLEEAFKEIFGKSKNNSSESKPFEKKKDEEVKN